MCTNRVFGVQTLKAQLEPGLGHDQDEGSGCHVQGLLARKEELRSQGREHKVPFPHCYGNRREKEREREQEMKKKKLFYHLQTARGYHIKKRSKEMNKRISHSEKTTHSHSKAQTVIFPLPVTTTETHSEIRSLNLTKSELGLRQQWIGC